MDYSDGALPLVSILFYLVTVIVGQFFIMNFVLGVLLENVSSLDTVGSDSWRRKQVPT